MNTGTTTTVDERIVEMRIDNEKFEAGAKKTISILESLDRSLNKIGSDNVDGFDNIEKSLDKVTDRFSAMGIVGDQIMRNLTNKAMELVGQLKNMSTMLTTQQIGAGWDKYAGKVEAVQTIMASTNNLVGEGLKWANQEEQLAGVTEQLQRLTWFADETSYSFSDMVNNVGKFTAAGRDLEESVTAMQGISTWAAISGGRPAEAGRAMYNLSQALGLGAVTAIDWKSIELANMATYEFKQQAIDTAAELGILKKVGEGVWETLGGTQVTVEKFRDTLSVGKGENKEQWFTSDVLLKVLDRYGSFAQLVADAQDAFGYDSATYVLSDLKNYEKMLDGDSDAAEELRKNTAKLGITIDDLKSKFDVMLRPEYDLGRRAFQAAQEAKTFQEAIDATRDAVSTKWMDVFEALFGNYLEAKELWTKMSEVMWNIFARPVDNLLAVITNAQGFFHKDGSVSLFSDDVGEAAGGTAILEDRLAAVGKTMTDFHKALEKVIGSEAVHRLIQDYHSIDGALLQGAISVDQFKLALGELDDSFDTKKPTTLNRALNKAGKTAADFEKALHEAMDPKDIVRALEKYSSLEDAFRNGAISVEDFKEALNSLGIDSENVTEDIQETVKTGVGNIAEMRELALEVLRGDHGNGDERLAWYESMGLDPELMQAMVGDLKNIARAGLDDDYLLEIMESYYQANNLQARLGYATFAEYLASCMGTTEEYVYDMNHMANEAENIYASLFGSGVLDESGELISAGELFRKSLTNLLDALKNFGDAFDAAFMRVFGGHDLNKQIYNMSDGFFTLTAAFYSFSEKVKAFSENESLYDLLEAFFSIIRIIGKTLGFVFKIGRIGLSLIFKLLSPIFTLVTSIFDVIGVGLDSMSRTIDKIGIFDMINEFGDKVVEKIQGPIDKINDIIRRVTHAFKKGFEEDGFEEGLKRVGEAFDQLFENSPVALTIIHALEKAFTFLANAIGAVVGVAGGLFGGAVMAIIGVFQTLIDWIGKAILWAKDSEIINAIWDSIAETFTKVGNVLKRVFGKGGYAEQGFEEGGFVGAFNAVVDSFERGLTRLVPGGEKIVAIIEALRNVFRKKSSDENGVTRMVDDTEGQLLSLEETFDKRGGFFASIIRGAGGDDEAKEEVKEGISGLVDSAWQGFLNALRNVKISDVIDALKLGVIADILLKVGHGINIINGLADNISDIPDRFNDMLEDLGQMFRSIAVNFQMTAIKQLGVGILLIAGSIWILSRIPAEQLEKASSTVMAIILLLTLLVKVLVGTSANLFKNLAGLPALGLALIGFASTIAAIGTTVLILAAVAKFIGVNELKWAVGAIMAIVLTIGILIAGLIKSVKNGNFGAYQIESLGAMFGKIGLSMMGLALAVQMLMIPIIVFCGILKLARGTAGILKFAGAVAAVLAIIWIVGQMYKTLINAVKGFNAKQLGQIGSFLIKLSASLVIIAFAVTMLMTPILILSAAQKLLGSVQGVIEAMALLFLFIGAVAGVLAALGASLAKNKKKQIDAAGNALLKMGASILLVALGVSLLASPIMKLAKLSEEIYDGHIIRSLIYLTVMLGILAGILALIGNLFKGKNAAQSLGFGKGLFKIAAGIAMLALAALLLAPAVILLTGAIAAFTYALGRMDDDRWLVFENGLERLKKFAKPLMLFGAALAIVGLAATLTGTGILSLALGILVFAGTIGILMVAFPMVVDAFKKLEEIDDTKITKSIGKAWLMLGGLLIAMTLFAYAVTRIYSLLGGGTFRRIGDGFINTIKNMALSMRTGVSNGFSKTIEFLKDSKNQEAIISALRVLILVGAAYVAGVIPTLTHVIIGGITTLISSIATEVAEQSGPLVDSLFELVESLLIVAKDLIAKLFGEESWSEMSWWQKGIADLGGGLLVINKVAGLFSFGKAEESANTLSDKIFGLAEGITDTKERICGMKDSFNDTKAAVQLLVEAAGGLSVVLPVALALAAAVGYANHELNAQQDILRTNAGDPKSLEEYANSIAQVEARIDELQTAVNNGATEFTITQELDAQRLLLRNLEKEYEELKTSQEESNVTAAESVEATHQLTDAELQRQEQLEARKRKSQEAAAAAQEETEAINEEISAFDRLKEQFGSSADMFGDIDIFDKIKEAVANQGVDINDLIKTDGSGLDIEKFKSMINVDKLKTDLSAQLSDVGMFIPEGIAVGVPDGESYLTSALSSVKDTLLETLFSQLGIASPSTVMANEVGQYIPAGIGMGIDQNYYQAVNPLYRLTDEMRSVFTNVRGHFVRAGTQVVAGLIEGISDNREYAYEAAKNLGITVKNGFAESLRIESPSKVFADLARYIPLGIEQGIGQESDSAISSVVVLSDALMDAIMQSMAMVSTVADDSFEFNPTITPVVDLSNVNSAAGAVGGLFGENYNVSAGMSSAISRRMDNVERIASAMNNQQTINNGDNITFNIYQQPGEDPNAIVDAVIARMSTRMSRRGAAFG